MGLKLPRMTPMSCKRKRHAGSRCHHAVIFRPATPVLAQKKPRPGRRQIAAVHDLVNGKGKKEKTKQKIKTKTKIKPKMKCMTLAEEHGAAPAYLFSRPD